MNPKPVFAFVTIGSGSYLGSAVRDATLANMLHRRGFDVAFYWMLEWKRDLLDPGIRQRLLCHGTRYQFPRPSEFLDRVVGSALFLLPQRWRVAAVQRSNGYADRLFCNLVCSLQQQHPDRSLVARLNGFISRDRVSHLMMSFASIGPLALAAKGSQQRFDYLLTFQGDEEFADCARRVGLFDRYRARLAEAIDGSAWPAIAVSRDYRLRIEAEMGVPSSRVHVIGNGVSMPAADAEGLSFSALQSTFPDLVEGRALITCVGRQDPEKGLDLLLYAAKLLQARGVSMQIVICGPTAKGGAYRKVIADLAGHLRLTIIHAGAVTPEIRNALYAHSRCVVCPSVNREPFGLVVAEAMSFGTPVVVPDFGGVAEVIRNEHRAGGLTFRTWDSGDLACQLERLLTDDVLHAQLADNAREVASSLTADTMTDRVLAHLGLPVSGTASFVAR